MYEFEYMTRAAELLQKVHDTEKEKIRKLAELFAKNIKNNHIIHVFGTGHSHMIGIEMFCRAGGLANVDAVLDPDALPNFGARRSGALEKLSGLADIIFENYCFEKGDILIIISNSGRNALPIEMAMRAKQEGIYTVALTNLHQSKNTISRHQSGKRLFECVDMVLDNGVPDGDSLMEVGGVKTGPGSTISSIFLLDTIVTEALKILAMEGVPLPVFASQNVDGFNNDALYEKYEARVKHF